MAELVIFKNKQELERLESTISRNMKAFYEVGCALAEIRDKGYYKDVLGFATFEEYCKVKWSMARRTAYQFIDSSTVVENVRNCAQIEAIPETESQARPLARLEPEQQRNVWEKVVEIAPEGKITASLVSKITKRMFPMAKKENKIEVKPQFPSDAVLFAGIAISQLRRIHEDDPKKNEALDTVLEWIKKEKEKQNDTNS